MSREVTKTLEVKLFNPNTHKREKFRETYNEPILFDDPLSYSRTSAKLSRRCSDKEYRGGTEFF